VTVPSDQNSVRALELARQGLTRPGAPPALPSRLLVVDVERQVATWFESGAAIAAWPVSTARNGVGGEENSFRTPPGWHCIQARIGESAAPGTVFVSREPTGATWRGEPGEADLILTRILTLDGLEHGVNRGAGCDSLKRYIYLHGTNQEQALGRPLSHGCVRLSNNDITQLFDRVREGDLVFVAAPQALAIPDPWGGGRFHYAGLGGAGMSALAQFQVMTGGRVSGSDRAFDRGERAGMRAQLERLGIAVLANRGGDDSTDVADEVLATDDAGGAASGAATVAETRPVEVIGEPLPVYESSDADPAVGLTAPVLEGASFDGTPITIGGPTDGPTLVVFLAHWCPHCNREVPELIALNDRGGIYALGYPVVSPLGHIVELAEVTALAGLAYVLLLAATTAFGILTSGSHLRGRVLLRERVEERDHVGHAGGELGLVIAAGMTIGTLFTLFITPAVYTYLAKDHQKAKAKLAEALGEHGPETGTQPEPAAPAIARPATELSSETAAEPPPAADEEPQESRAEPHSAEVLAFRSAADATSESKKGRKSAKRRKPIPPAAE